MKFEYNTKGDDRECVAYIDFDGDLVVKGGYIDSRHCTVMMSDEWDPSNATHKFYPGDKVTITF